MKRITAVCVLFLSLVLLVSCAHMTGTSTSPVLDRIKQNNELVVGTAGSMPPFNMTTKNGKIIGLDVDLALFMAGAMDVKLRLETMPFAELIPALESGTIDMVISNMTITPKRNMRVAFVGPYFVSGKALLTKVKPLADIQDPDEINNNDVKLAALKGSTGQMFIEELIPNATLVTTTDYDEAINMVIDGKVDAMVADHPICILSVLRNPSKGLITLVSPLTYEPIGIALPSNDPQFVNLVDNFLTTLKDSKGLNALRDQWFKDGSWLRELE